MMKFFRKHNKKLLAVFMVALMIVFLGGTALDGLLQGAVNRDEAYSRFGPITSSDYQNALDLTRILNAMGLPWERPLQGFNRPKIEIIDWILLSKEAKDLGTHVPLHQIRATMVDNSVIDDLARRLRKKPERILQALAQFNTIRQTALSVSGVTTPSQSEVVTAIRRSMEKVRVNAVVLPSTAFIDAGIEFTQDQIQTHFEKYREREAGEGLAFGYYVQPKLKVQYIKIDQDAVAEKARIPNLENKAKAFYNDQRDKNPIFRRPLEETPAEEIEGPQAEKTPFLVWDEAKDKAIEHVRNAAAKDATADIANWLIQYAGEPWYDILPDDDGFKEPPTTAVALEYYDSIIKNIPRTIAYPEALSTASTDFFDESEAEYVPELGTSFFVGGRAGVWETLGTIAFRTKAIVEKVPNRDGVSSSSYLATFQTSQFALRDQVGNTYVIRVIDSRPGHVAESVDEVREKVIADMRLAQGFEEAKARAESLRSCGSSMTLQEAYQSDEELVNLIDGGGFFGAGYLEPPAFPRSARMFATSGSPPRPYLGAGIGKIPLHVLNECFALTDRDSKMTSFELEDRAAVMVVEWAEIERPDASAVDEQSKSYLSEIERNRSRDVIDSWLNPQNIQARNGFSLETN